MSFDLIIFDCDGVLVDSEPIANRVLMDVLAEVGLTMSYDEAMRTFVGRSDQACVAMIEARLGHPLPAGFAAEWDSRAMSAFRRELRAIDGVQHALERIAVPVCVASNSTHDRMRLKLELSGLLQEFDGRLFSAADVEHGKPHPDLFLHAARTMRTAPAACAVVEDTTVGVTAGVAAGMAVFGYAGGADTDPADLERAGARVFYRMADLPTLLEQ